MSGLPIALARWEESLAALSVEVTRAVGPMLPMIEELIGRLDRRGGEFDEPDGYDGTTNRGEFSRLLMDGWLLAEELPEEFFRRAAENELSFLRLAHRAETPSGRVVVVVDTGPEQLGVGRLVQLAALVVLHRRAIEAGTELVLVLLGAVGPTAHPGGGSAPSDASAAQPCVQIIAGPEGLSPALIAWLNARSADTSTAAEVAGAFTAADEHDRVWLLAGPTVRLHAPPGHRRSVSCQVVRWDDSGAGRLAIRVGDSTAEVEAPHPPAAVAALRGEGLFRRRTDPGVTSVPTTGRGAVFYSADTRLLWRGETDREIFGCFVTRDAKVRRYRFGGSVLAVNSLGKRVVAAVTDGQTLWIEVIGKKLARTDRIDMPLADLNLDTMTLGAMVGEPPMPLHLQGGQIVMRLGSNWWGLADQSGWNTGMLAVGPGHALDNPHALYSTSTGSVRLGGEEIGNLVAGPILGPPAADEHAAPWVAWSCDSRVWKVAHAKEVAEDIAVQEHDRIVGLGLISGNPFLLVTSESGRIVRQVSSHKVRTWTRWAGPAHFSLHPNRPWLARTTEDRITVGDLQSGETQLEIKASS